MKNLSRTNVALFLGLLLFAGTLSRPLSAQISTCGDFNGDGDVNIQDFVLEMEYLVKDGAPPVNFDTADFDGRQFISIGDAQSMLTCFFNCGGGQWGTCAPTESPLAPTLEPGITLRYPNRIRPGVTSFDLPLTMVNAPQYQAFLAPLLITIDGSPAVVDSITFPAPGSVFGVSSLAASSIDGSGVVRLGLVSQNPPAASPLDVPAVIHLAVPVSAVGSVVEVNWTILSPVQAPVPDSSLYPIFYRFSGDDGFVPTLQGGCCLVPGDANYDGSFNISDVTFLIARIFSGGVAPLCPQASDANGDGDTNIADVTYGVARIFSGGPAPICGP